MKQICPSSKFFVLARSWIYSFVTWYDIIPLPELYLLDTACNSQYFINHAGMHVSYQHALWSFNLKFLVLFCEIEEKEINKRHLSIVLESMST